MQELGQIVDMAVNYASKHPDKALLGAAVIDTARYSSGAILGELKSRFDYGSTTMTQNEVSRSIGELEESLDGGNMNMDAINRYLHPYRTGKLHGFKSIYERLGTQEPWNESWTDSASYLEPSDD